MAADFLLNTDFLADNKVNQAGNTRAIWQAEAITKQSIMTHKIGNVLLLIRVSEAV